MGTLTRSSRRPPRGQHILETALAGDFGPSLSYRLRLDHDLCLPLSLLALARMPCIGDHELGLQSRPDLVFQ